MTFKGIETKTGFTTEGIDLSFKDSEEDGQKELKYKEVNLG